MFAQMRTNRKHKIYFNRKKSDGSISSSISSLLYKNVS